MQYEFYVKYCVERLSQGSPAHLPLWATTRFFGRWIESCCQVGNRKQKVIATFVKKPGLVKEIWVPLGQ